MITEFTNKELEKIYKILKAYDDSLIVNPCEDWEMDYYDEPFIEREGIKPILKKIESSLPKKEFSEMNKNILRRKYDVFNNQVDENIYSKIEKAFNQRKRVEIGYFNMESAEVRKREVDVYYKSRKYVIGYCHLRKAMRKFRASRIVKAKILDKKYEIPASFNKNNY